MLWKLGASTIISAHHIARMLIRVYRCRKDNGASGFRESKVYDELAENDIVYLDSI